MFERFASPEVVRAYQRLTMPMFRVMAGVSPGYGIIETTGRRTGRRHQVPVGGRRRGDEFWFVAGIGRSAGYVRNIEADPRVRVKLLGRWHSGTATICEDDNAQRRMFSVSPINGLFLLIAGGRRLSIRIDLDE